MNTDPTKLPFNEAIDYFKQKGNDATGSYKGVHGFIHDRAFMVAGCMRDDILLDIRAAVDDAITNGRSLQEFQKTLAQKNVFDRWEQKHDKGWRARVIYDTNIATAYSAGRYHQMQETKAYLPYWQYKHGPSRVPRQEHLDYNNIVLKADDPWWDIHYPPNGWGCSCYVQALSQGDIERMGIKVSKSPKPMKDLDPYWQHAPGKEAHIWPDRPPKGKPSPKVKTGEWVPDKNWLAKDGITPLPNRENLGNRLQYNRNILSENKQEKRKYVVNFLKDNILGGEESKTVSIKYGKTEIPLLISANGFGGHIAQDFRRLECLGYLKDVLNPQEMRSEFSQWVSEDKKTWGKWSLCHILVTTINDPRYKGLVLVCQNNGKGSLEAYTFYPVEKLEQLTPHRKGRLIPRIRK